MNKEPKRNVYVGHRYVPKIMGEWDKSISYEGLSIVTYQGGSYTSKKRVPVGIDILNEEYWVITGNYNAQVEQYRQDVRNLEDKHDNDMLDLRNDLEEDIDDFKDNIDSDILDFKNDINTTIKEIIVNVKDFGAIGDGNTDDTDSITDTIKYVDSVGGGIVFIPSGTYLINDNGIFINDIENIDIKISKGATLQMESSDKGYYYIMGINNSKNISVQGGTFKGDRFNHNGEDGERGFGIAILANSNNIKIYDNIFKEFWGDGLYVTDKPKNIIFDNVFCDNNRRQGISVTGGDNIKILNSRFTNTSGTNPQAGIDVEPANNNKVKNVIIENCYFNNNKVGIKVTKHGTAEADVKDVILKNNYIDNSRSHGMEIRRNCVLITGNIVVNSDDNGIYLINVDNVDITNNIVNNTNNRSIYFAGSGSNNCIIEGNSLTNGGNAGIQVNDGYLFNVNNNKIINMSGRGIGFSSSGNSLNIIGNNIKDVVTGFYVDKIDNVIINNNNIKNSERHSLYISNCNIITISNNILSNYFTSNGEHGSQIGTTKNMVMTNNVFKNGNADYGIGSHSITESLITNNYLKNSGNVGSIYRISGSSEDINFGSGNILNDGSYSTNME